MTYNPDVHHRRSIRLKEYDYSEHGMYFVTICAENRENLFGCIMNESMQLNNAGEMIQKWWQELENKFSHVILDEFVIMPNHFHGIIQINVGADPSRTAFGSLRIRPDDENDVRPDDENDGHPDYPGGHMNNKGGHIGPPLRGIESLSTIIQWFKTMTTNEYIRGVKSDIFPGFNKRIWQRDYYEHVIRDENDLNNIREYIINNPRNWENDSLFG